MRHDRPRRRDTAIATGLALAVPLIALTPTAFANEPDAPFVIAQGRGQPLPGVTAPAANEEEEKKKRDGQKRGAPANGGPPQGSGPQQPPSVYRPPRNAAPQPAPQAQPPKVQAPAARQIAPAEAQPGDERRRDFGRQRFEKQRDNAAPAPSGSEQPAETRRGEDRRRRDFGRQRDEPPRDAQGPAQGVPRSAPSPVPTPDNARRPDGPSSAPIARPERRERDEDRGNRRFDNRGPANVERGEGPFPQATRRQWRQERRETERNQGFINLDALKQRRQERTFGSGRSIIEEPGARRIIRGDGRTFITRDETHRLKRFGSDLTTRRRPGGGNITTVMRPNGTRIITELSPDGRLIRRYRRTRDGRDHVLFDNRRTWRKWGAIGAGAALGGLFVAIDPPRWRGPRERYIIEYDNASYDDIYDALIAEPIDRLDRGYSLDEVLGTYNLRERMRRIDLDSINFQFGSWTVDESQYDKLERVARAMSKIIDRNQDEVFLIEGHTDAVGDEVDNLTLSDRRAEEVANILQEEFDIPPENLVTQGYGEEFLKIDTDGPERANRRVTLRRITPLLERRTSRYED